MSIPGVTLFFPTPFPRSINNLGLAKYAAILHPRAKINAKGNGGISGKSLPIQLQMGMKLMTESTLQVHNYPSANQYFFADKIQTAVLRNEANLAQNAWEANPTGNPCNISLHCSM